MVGERGFEPPTPWSRTRCSTRLSHSPNLGVKSTSSGAAWCVFPLGCASISVAESSGYLRPAFREPTQLDRHYREARRRGGGLSFHSNLWLLFLLRSVAPGKIPSIGARSFSSPVRIGQRFAGHHLVALRRVVDENRLHRGDLLQVRCLQAFVLHPGWSGACGSRSPDHPG